MRTTFRHFVLLLLALTFSVRLFSTTPQTALRDYLALPDASYAWTVVDSTQVADVKAYKLRLVSQTWRGFPWIHELFVMIPLRVRHSEALLHITGGSADPASGEPNSPSWDDEAVQALGLVAHNCQAVTAVLRQVPRQPLYGNLREDELMSYTFHQFQETGDFTWPLIFPMTKSAIRAMDAISELTASRKVRKAVEKFVINGISKRGWTTWMTAASEDERVVAIAPMVIDILNMPVNVPYQLHMYGSYSREIQDYVNLGLADLVNSTKGKGLVRMVDPYSYRSSFDLPKIITFGTNDQYWTVDAVRNYIDSIPGPSLLNYVPNTNHSLGDKKAAISSVEAFFLQTLRGGKYPTVDSRASLSGQQIDLQINFSRGKLLKAEVWEACSDNRDFRDRTFQPVFTTKPKGKKFSLPVSLPSDGNKAFFAMLTFRHPLSKRSYTLCSRMYTADSRELFQGMFQP